MKPRARSETHSQAFCNAAPALDSLVEEVEAHRRIILEAADSKVPSTKRTDVKQSKEQQIKALEEQLEKLRESTSDDDEDLHERKSEGEEETQSDETTFTDIKKEIRELVTEMKDQKMKVGEFTD